MSQRQLFSEPHHIHALLGGLSAVWWDLRKYAKMMMIIGIPDGNHYIHRTQCSFVINGNGHSPSLVSQSARSYMCFVSLFVVVVVVCVNNRVIECVRYFCICDVTNCKHRTHASDEYGTPPWQLHIGMSPRAKRCFWMLSESHYDMVFQSIMAGKTEQ